MGGHAARCVCVVDFGIAKALAHADLTAAGARKGALPYMAPEQLAGQPVTQACDQFALGATLTELAGGALTPERAAIAASATAVEPRDRFASIDELRAALEAVTRAGAAALSEWVLTRITS